MYRTAPTIVMIKDFFATESPVSLAPTVTPYFAVFASVIM
jgi:hypothetical protein